jgi:hypothetical protein
VRKPETCLCSDLEAGPAGTAGLHDSPTETSPSGGS